MKKITFFLMAMLLVIGAAFAQQTKTLKNNSLQLQPVAQDAIDIEQENFSHEEGSGSKGAVIFTNGFEGTTGGTTSAAGSLPTGWISSPTSGTLGTARWGTTAGPIVGVTGNIAPHGGTRLAYIAYTSAAHNAWMITPAFSLTAGTTYQIEFWVIMQGYDWYEELEVRIGTSNTVAAMTTSLWSSYTEDFVSWTKQSIIFTPTTSGNHYLGFYSTSQDQIFTAVDDILVKEVDDNDMEIVANFPYTQIPTMLPLSTINAKATNVGLQPQTNVRLSAELNSTNIGTSSSVATVAPDETVALTIPTSATLAMGANTLVYTVIQDEIDENLDNNTATFNFQGTPSVYAVDNVTTTSNGIGSNSGALTFGNIFEISTAQTLSQVYIGFNSTATALNYTLSLYKMTGDLTCENTDLLSGFAAVRAPGWNVITVPPISLEAGSRYFLCVNQLGFVVSSDNVAVSYESVAGKILYVLNPDYSLYTGNAGYAAAIRMVLQNNACTANAPTDLNVVTTPGSATFSWVGTTPLYFKLTLNDGTTTTTYNTFGNTITLNGLSTGNYTWSVAAMCDAINGNSTTGTSFFVPSCTVSTFPFIESFDGTTFPPSCWTSLTTTNTPWKRVTTGTSPTCTTHSGAGMMQFNCYSSPYTNGTKGLIITPPIDGQNQTMKVVFWMYRDNGYTSYNNEVVNVYSNNETSLTGASLLLTIPRASNFEPVVAANGWYEYSAMLPVSSEEIFVVFEGVSQYGNNIYVDDVSIEIIRDLDMRALSLTGNTTPMATLSYDYVVTVQNNGALPVNNFTVSLFTEDGDLLGTEAVSQTLAYLETTTITFPATFVQAQAGPMTLKAVVTLVGDEEPSNNETFLTIDIIPHPGYELDCSTEATITTGTVATNYTLPSNNLYNGSYTQQIYDAAEIGLEPGTPINSIAFLPTHATSNVWTKVNQSIYLANIGTKSTFTSATDHIPTSQLQEVVAPRTIAFNHNVNPTWQTIEFDQPFIYDGGNIAVVYINRHTAYQSANTFRTGTATGKAISAYSDTYAFSPGNIGTASTTTYAYRNHVKFVACDKYFTLHPDNIGDPMFTLDPIPEGEDGTVYFNIPDELCIFDVLFDGVSQGHFSSYTFTNVTEPLPFIEIITSLPLEITATAGPNGTISPIGVIEVCPFENQVFILMPNPGYLVSELFIDDVAVTPPSNNRYTFTSVEENHTIHVTFEPCPTFDVNYIVEGMGVINYDNQDYDGTGTFMICSGLNPEFTFIPDFGYEIEAVYIDGIQSMIASGGYYMFVNLLQNHTLRVVFKLIDYTIVASAGPNGTISPAGTITTPYQSNQTFTFTPNEGYVVSEVFVDNEPIGVQDSYTFEHISANHTIYVAYTRATMVIHISWTDGGVIAPEGNTYTPTAANAGDVYVLYNQTQRLDLVPEEGYKVSMVYVNGVAYPNAVLSGHYTFYYTPEEQWFHVTYEKQTNTIVSHVDAHGMITPQGTTMVEYGEQQLYTFYAMPGYKIKNVFVDGINNEEAILNGAFTFTNVTGPHTINVITTPLSYKITARADEGGFITPGDIYVTHGGNQLFTFVAASGYEIEKVLVDGIENTEALQNGSYAFINVTTAHDIFVLCKLMKFKVSAVANDNGTIEPAGITEINYGEDITYTIIPNADYEISYVLVNGINFGAIENYTFAAIDADGTIEVFFAPVEEDDEVGIIDPDFGIGIYSNINIVYIVNDNLLPISDVSIFDMYGRVVWQGKPQGNQIVLNVANGIYTVRITANGNFTTTKVNIHK